MGVPVGAGLGFLYSMTTISGPPIAVLFNNQDLVKRDFRAGLALIRVAESTLTAIAYYQLGLFAAGSFHMILIIAPGILIGIPLGVYTIRRSEEHTSELQSQSNLVCRLLLEKKKKRHYTDSQTHVEL